MALAEAMSAGLPAIGFKSCSGVNEIITHDFDGLLVDDGSEALAEGMCELMSNTKKRISMGNNASESMKKFDPLKIWDQWDFCSIK